MGCHSEFRIQNTFKRGATKLIRVRWHEPPSRTWSGEAEEDEQYPYHCMWVHVKLGVAAWHPGRLDVHLHFTLPRWFFDCTSRKIIALVQP